MDSNRNSHFMGTIVYAEGESTATFRAFTVIDGQQRLTTIMLLLKAIADYSEDEELKEVLDTIGRDAAGCYDFGLCEGLFDVKNRDYSE